jgi:hypothetical protein
MAARPFAYKDQRSDRFEESSMRVVKPAVAALGLVCSGCVVAAPPPPMPVATAAPAPQNCREFEQTIMVGGQAQKGYGTTCQQPDGSWKIVAQPGQTPPPATVAAYLSYPAYYYPPYYYPPYYYPPFYGRIRLGFHGRF